MWDRLCDVLDAPDMHDHPNYATGRARSENRNSVNAQIEEYTVTKSSAEWIDVMTEAGVPCGPIYSIDEVFSDPQVEHVNMQHPVRHPVLGEMNLVGQAINFSRYKPKTGMPTPESGEHTDDILSELKFDADAIADLRARGII